MRWLRPSSTHLDVWQRFFFPWWIPFVTESQVTQCFEYTWTLNQCFTKNINKLSSLQTKNDIYLFQYFFHYIFAKSMLTNHWLSKTCSRIICTHTFFEVIFECLNKVFRNNFLEVWDGDFVRRMLTFFGRMRRYFLRQAGFSFPDTSIENNVGFSVSDVCRRKKNRGDTALELAVRRVTLASDAGELALPGQHARTPRSPLIFPKPGRLIFSNKINRFPGRKKERKRVI